MENFVPIFFSVDLLDQHANNTGAFNALVNSFDDLKIFIENDTSCTISELKQLLPHISEKFGSVFSCTLLLVCIRSFSKEEFELYSDGLVPSVMSFSDASSELGSSIDRLLRKSIHLYLSILTRLHDVKNTSHKQNPMHCGFDFSEFERLSLKCSKPRCENEPAITIDDMLEYFPLADLLDILLLTSQDNHNIICRITQLRGTIFPSIFELDAIEFTRLLQSLRQSLQSPGFKTSHAEILKMVADLKSLGLLVSVFPKLILTSKANLGVLLQILGFCLSEVPTLPFFNALFRSHIYAILLIVFVFIFDVAAKIDISQVGFNLNTEFCTKLSKSLGPVVIPFPSSVLLPKSTNAVEMGREFLKSHKEYLSAWICEIKNTNLVSILNDDTLNELATNMAIDESDDDPNRHTRLIEHLKEIFPNIPETSIENILVDCNWDPQHAFESLSRISNQDVPNTESISKETIYMKNSEGSEPYLGSDLNEILKTKIRVIVESNTQSSQYNGLEFEDSELTTLPRISSGFDDSEDQNEDKEGKGSGAGLDAILRGEYLENAKAFLRSARNSPERRLLKAKCKLSDEQIEGWARINLTASSDKKTTISTTDYLDPNAAVMWTGQQASIADKKEPQASNSSKHKGQSKEKAPHLRKSHFRKDRAMGKLAKSTGPIN